MAQTIPGGAYQSTDGRWHDANGRPLPSSAVRQYEELQAQREAEAAQASAVLAQQLRAALPTGAPVSTATPSTAAPLTQGPAGPQSASPALTGEGEPEETAVPKARGRKKS